MLRIEYRHIAACLLASLVVIAGSRESLADPILGIVVSGTTVMPTGDPFLSYDFQLSELPNSSLQHGDNITLLDIPGSYVSASFQYGFSSAFTILMSSDGSGGTIIELELTAVTPPDLDNSSSGSVSFGDLFVTTSVQVVPDLTVPIDYTNLSHSFSSKNDPPLVGSGMTTPAIVPEPASLTMCSSALAAVALFLARRRDSKGSSHTL